MSQPNLPLVSIVIPYYNCEKYIAETLASVEAQTYPNIEIILVNDGSSKASTVYIEVLIQDTNIKYIYQENKGVSSARNTGVKVAKGEFLLFLDADDLILPSYITQAIEIFSNHSKCKLVYSKAKFFEASNDEWILQTYTSFKNLLLENHIPIFGLHKTEDFKNINGFDESLKSHEDWDYWIRLLQDGGEVIRIDEILFLYRKRFDQSSLIDKLSQDERLNTQSWQAVYLKNQNIFIKNQLSYHDLVQSFSRLSILQQQNQLLFEQNTSLQIQNQELNYHKQKLDIQHLNLQKSKEQLEADNIQLLSANNYLQNLTTELKDKNTLLNKLNDNLDKSIVNLEQEKQTLANTINDLNNHVHGLNTHQNALTQAIHQESYKFKKFKKLWILRLLKPLIKMEQGLHSLNRYRKAFRLLMREKGSFGKAYQTVRRYYKANRLKNTKKFLKSFIEPEQNTLSLIEQPTKKFNLSEGVIIVTTQHTHFVAKLISQCLNQVNIPNQIIFDMPKTGFNDQWHIVICPQIFDKMPKYYIAFQMEQSVSSRWFSDDYFNRLKNAHFVFDYSLTNIEYLHSNNISFNQLYYLPIGTLNTNLDTTNTHDYDYDVAFYGDVNCERRKNFIERLKERFNVKVISEVFGIELHNQLKKARIIVNIHYYENALLESTRLYECLSLGKLVISEKGSDQQDYLELDNIIDFVEIDDIDGMINRISFWLNSKESFNQRLVDINNFQQKPSQFNFYFYRFMLAQDLISFDQFYELSSEYIQPQGDFWCLSLPESTQRRKDFQKDNKYNIWLFTGLRHNIGWVGCGLSYKFMTKRAEDLNLPQVTICEDDVLFYENFYERYTNIKSTLLKSHQNWDIFSGLISDMSQEAKISTSDILCKNDTLYTIDKLISMVFNIYSKNSYSKVYNWNENYRPVASLENTIDRYIQDCGKFSGLTISPFLVGHKEDLYSTLWNHPNTAYNEMIEKSQDELDRKIRILENKRNGITPKTVLLAMPDHVDLYKCIKKNLEYCGFEVSLAIINGSKITYKPYDSSIQTNFSDNQKILTHDYAVFIRSDLFIKTKFIQKIKSHVTHMIAYQWDYMNRFPSVWEAVKYFDKFFVFDVNDFSNNHANIHPLTNFYFDYQPSKQKTTIDFYFIGCHVEGREYEINLFAKTANEHGWSLDFEIIAPSADLALRWKQIYNNKNVKIGTRFKSFQENLNNALNSRILVDFKTPGQDGLSFRSFEALGYKKKLVTTNSNIRFYDFYHPNNIFIWDGKNLNDLKDFLELPYVEVDEDIRQKYSFSNWIRYILNIEPHQTITLPQPQKVNI